MFVGNAVNNSNIQYLYQRLDAFIRKYYLNQVIRGSLYLLAVVLSVYLLFSITEYYLYLSTTIRKVLFYSFLTGGGYLIIRWLLLPLLRYLRLGKLMDYQQASSIIGAHFPEVEDRLLNILQLQSQAEQQTDRTLIDASIQQKMNAIKPVPFQLAIDLRKNRKYLPFALPPVAVFLFLLFASPNLLVDSNYRLLNNGRHFEKQAPFSFMVPDNLQVIQYNNFELTVRVEGRTLPEQMMVQTAAGTYQMEKTGPNTFLYQFNKVAVNTPFQLQANGFLSKTYELEVLPKPAIQSFRVSLDYPAHTGMKDEVLENTGDLQVPEGTHITWTFSTRFTQQVDLFFSDTTASASQQGKERFSYQKTAFKDGNYAIGMGNDQLYNRDTLSYYLQVTPDAFPMVEVDEIPDSADLKYLYFIGRAEDDYGFTKAGFYYTIERQSEKGVVEKAVENVEKVLLTRGGSRAGFTYAFDLNKFSLQPGDRVSYYFMVWDNDGVRGPKSSKSKTMQFQVPTVEELKDERNAGNESLQKDLEGVLEALREMREESNDLEEKLLQQKELNWEDKRRVEDLLKQQQQLQQQVNEMKETFQQNLEKEQEYLKPEEKILEKQQQLEALFEEVMTEEMKKLYEELKELLEQMNKEQSLQELQEMDMNNEQLEQELDRMLELFKQLQIEQQMQEAISELEKLAEEQLSLSEETKDKNAESEEMLQEQEEIEKKFEELQEELKNISEKNESLENPAELPDSEQQQQEIQQNLDQSKQELKQNNKKKASEQQQQAGKKMEQMAQDMKEQMSRQQMEQQQEDMRALSQLLDNLIKLSVTQESLMLELEATPNTNPRYVELMANQQRIKEDTRMVEDSLLALSKRVPQISSFITREMTEVNRNLQQSLASLHERNTRETNMFQQYSMTGYNNLALMLNEVMQQMQEQMAQSMPGAQMCQKPGGSSSLPSMGEMQKQLNEQLQKMKGEMNQGPKPGQRQGMSQQLAEMAAQQAAIREALQKLADELGGGNTEDGKLARQLQQIADQMDKTEEDLVNKRLTEETLRRQEEILTRLLDAEESERERKKEETRQSETADEKPREMPAALEEYMKKRQASLDLYKTVAPELMPFYKKLVETYFEENAR